MAMTSPANSIADEIFSDDLISEILVRLPVKSILRFKSVSKPWLSLISSSSFVKSHLRRAAGADKTLIVREDNISLSLVRRDSFELVAYLRPPFTDTYDYLYYGLVGIYNGIICADILNVYDTQHRDLHLWNPATKQFKLLPPAIINKKIIKPVHTAFGFDPISNDFKVLRVLELRNKLRSAEVYSLNLNVWRKLDAVDISWQNYYGVCVNGFLCYRSVRRMAVFDLNKEVFVFGIKVPALYCQGTRVFEVKGSMAIVGFSSDYDFKRSYISLWTLDDDACLRVGGVEASWTLIRSIELHMLVRDVYGCSNNGDLLLKSDKGYYLYNSSKKKVKCFSEEVFHVCNYTESLFSVT